MTKKDKDNLKFVGIGAGVTLLTLGGLWFLLRGQRQTASGTVAASSLSLTNIHLSVGG